MSQHQASKVLPLTGNANNSTLNTPAHTPATDSSNNDISTVLAENWKVIAAVAAVGVLGGAAYYFATKSSDSPSSSQGDKKKGPNSKSKDDKLSKDISSSNKEVKGKDDKLPKDTSKEVKGKEKSKVTEKNTESELTSLEEISNLSLEERLERAKRAKEKGNKYFQAKHYEKAIELYTDAILLQPEGPEAAVYYSNRAACYSNLNKYEKVVEDATEALKHDKKYVKALNRRATAYESLQLNEQALVDLTASCILDGFTNESTLKSADRIIKNLGTIAATEYMKNRKPFLPASYFTSAYFESYKNKVENTIPESTGKEADDFLIAGLKLVQEKKYDDAFEKIDAAIKGDTIFKAQAHNLRGTFYYLMGCFQESLDDFKIALEQDPKSVNSLIKRASVFFEKKEIDTCFEEFEKAISINADDPDIYYHRGQAHFIVGNMDGALKDYEKSIKLDSNIPYVHVQFAVLYFRLQLIQRSIEGFKAAIDKFPNYGDVYNYYGEVLLELGQYQDAAEQFEKAIQLNPRNPLNYINKAFLLAKWKEDTEQATALINKAIEMDPKCEVAYAHLGQMHVQAHRLHDAIDAYQHAVECSRTEVEATQWFSCIEASKAQIQVFEIYPEVRDLTAAKKQ